jgi:hypothetical protein
MPMRKRKWFIPVVVVSVLLIGGIAGGVIAAADDSSSNTEDQSQIANRHQVLLDRACAIYEEKPTSAWNGGSPDPISNDHYLGLVGRVMGVA